MACAAATERPASCARLRTGSGSLDDETASFVPPPPLELPKLLTDWERFANEDAEMPLLVQNALLHAQFETIHPFLDDNGRLGRLLLVYFLIARRRMSAPLLYLSSCGPRPFRSKPYRRARDFARR